MTGDLTFDAVINMAPIHSFHGQAIHTSDAMVEQYRFPKGRNRRIRRKWSKRPENWRPMRGALFVKDHNAIYIHPDVLAEIKTAL